MKSSTGIDMLDAVSLASLANNIRAELERINHSTVGPLDAQQLVNMRVDDEGVHLVVDWPHQLTGAWPDEGFLGIELPGWVYATVSDDCLQLIVRPGIKCPTERRKLKALADLMARAACTPA